MKNLLAFDRRRPAQEQDHLSTGPRVRTLLSPETNIGHELTSTPNLRIVRGDEDQSRGGPVSIDDLYPSPNALSPDLANALRLLHASIARVNDAIEAEDAADVIGVANECMRLQVLLPELFCCRSLGDGFGAVVNSIFHALRNAAGSPLNQVQLRALRRALEKLRAEPFMRFDTAVDVTMSLEDSGFTVEPEAFEYLADWLDE